MSSSPDQPAKAQPSRLPSLNQLAARININAPNGAASPPAAASTAAPRPRLAAFTLRTTGNASTTSLSTVATTDSMAVNASSTRSASPAALSASPRSGTPSNETVPGGDTHLTSEKLDKLNQETVSDKKSGVKVGYKNIPSLDAITARLQKTRALSVDGTAKPPDAEMIEDPKTPGFPMKAPEHPLEYPWTIYHDCKTKVPFPSAPATPLPTPPSATSSEGFVPHPPESTDYEAGLTVVGEFSTVEEFCRYFNWLKPPSQLERNSNYHLFKAGIKPMWEDEANANGGKWVLTMKNNAALLDRCWNWLAMALVGEELEEGHDIICGAVVSLRSKVDRIQVWTRTKDDVERLNAIGKKLVKLLDVSEADGIGLEFQYNTDDRPLPNKFLSIQALPMTSYRPTFQPPGTPAGRLAGHGRTESVGAGASGPYTPIEQSVPASAGPAGAFGSFGIGIGGGAAWRGAKRP
ncbi:translation initiation factor eIF 4e-like domain-containing protein [Mycena rosella]|uniref:Translation initiation factor eIF 4e-like domain-containing protein n=1 Tax=Mycena rosella TaxID=1033263 RepID=A0AAD7CUJ1_MYCRO|nr:translation initiation factor eIF 4e-like domain-containing protein [Mycena rosella]